MTSTQQLVTQIEELNRSVQQLKGHRQRAKTRWQAKVQCRRLAIEEEACAIEPDITDCEINPFVPSKVLVRRLEIEEDTSPFAPLASIPRTPHQTACAIEPKIIDCEINPFVPSKVLVRTPRMLLACRRDRNSKRERHFQSRLSKLRQRKPYSRQQHNLQQKGTKLTGRKVTRAQPLSDARKDGAGESDVSVEPICSGENAGTVDPTAAAAFIPQRCIARTPRNNVLAIELHRPKTLRSANPNMLMFHPSTRKSAHDSHGVVVNASSVLVSLSGQADSPNKALKKMHRVAAQKSARQYL